MKYLCFLLTSLNLSFIALAQQPHAELDVLHYRFEVELTDKDNRISGNTQIRVVLIKAATVINFDLISQTSGGKGMQVTQVNVNNVSTGFTHQKDRLSIEGDFSKNDTLLVNIRYDGVPADGLVISTNKFGDRGFFADHWPNRARNWLPCIDHPADKAPVEFLVTVPDHYQVVANGILIEQSSLPQDKKLFHYRETTPLPTKVMVIGVARFAVQLAGIVENIPVYSWVYPQDRTKGFYDYQLAASILPFFTKNIAPYAYGKLANVQSKTRFGGLENASAIFYSESSVTGTRSSEGLIAHEIAHQWFGNMATETDWAHLWLSEGFATYLTAMYLEQQYSIDTLKSILKKNRDQVIRFFHQKPRPVVDSSVTDYMELLNANSYQKGGWVLHMLRRQLGDSLYWKAVQTYYQRFAGKNASTEDFQQVVEEVSGTSYQQFFHQWLYVPGQPRLQISWTYHSQKKEVVINVLQQQDQLFEFPLTLQINKAVEAADYITTTINKRETTIVVKANSAPSAITPDPDIDLLAEIILLPNK